MVVEKLNGISTHSQLMSRPFRHPNNSINMQCTFLGSLGCSVKYVYAVNNNKPIIKKKDDTATTWLILFSA